MLISFAVTAKLICVFVFAYAKRWFSHDAAHLVLVAAFKTKQYFTFSGKIMTSLDYIFIKRNLVKTILVIICIFLNKFLRLFGCKRMARSFLLEVFSEQSDKQKYIF